MAENEANVISHLLNVEAQASDLVKEAQDEANKRISSVRAKANAEFKEEFDKIVVEHEKKYNDKISSVNENHKKTLEEYKSSVEHAEQDKDNFDVFLRKVLFEL